LLLFSSRMNSHHDWTHLVNNRMPFAIKLPGVMYIAIFDSVTTVTRVWIQLWLQMFAHRYVVKQLFCCWILNSDTILSGQYTNWDGETMKNASIALKSAVMLHTSYELRSISSISYCRTQTHLGGT